MSDECGMRKYPDDDGNLHLGEGEYGINPVDAIWYARPFGQHMGSLRNHTVVEHEGGAITVTPSILITGADENGETSWHGFLENGVWREC